jgi:phosphotransferase system  glucose/maltose/N-acetylglucosamine-specific IIC component
MKEAVLKILLIVIAIFAAFAWRQPIISVIDKINIEKELKEKTNEKDSLSRVVERIKENSEEKRRTARQMGYSKKGETMLKIVTPDAEKENEKVMTNALLSISAALILFLVIILAFSSKKKSKPK